MELIWTKGGKLMSKTVRKLEAEDLQKRIREAMDRKNLTITVVAEKMGYYRADLSKLLSWNQCAQLKEVLSFVRKHKVQYKKRRDFDEWGKRHDDWKPGLKN